MPSAFQNALVANLKGIMHIICSVTFDTCNNADVFHQMNEIPCGECSTKALLYADVYLFVVIGEKLNVADTVEKRS